MLPSLEQQSRRVDVHFHYCAPALLSAMEPRGGLPVYLQEWSPAKAIEDMDEAGVMTSFASITTPGVHFGDDELARRLARQCNEYVADLACNHPGRFGFFATLPMPDLQGSLREIEYSLDTLKANGIVLFTSYGTKWLGDCFFDPVFEELNRRGVVVYTHPTVAACCSSLIPNVPNAVVEYGTGRQGRESCPG